MRVVKYAKERYLLQSTAMSHTAVNEHNVYSTAGAPLPKDIDQILQWLLNESMKDAFTNISEICTDKGYALCDVLRELATKLMVMKLDAAPLAKLLNGMSNVEHRLASGTDEKIQTAALVGVFVQTRQLLQV